MLYQDYGIVKEDTKNGDFRLLLRGVVCKNHPKKHYPGYAHARSRGYGDPREYDDSVPESRGGNKSGNYIDYSSDSSDSDSTSDNLYGKRYTPDHRNKKPRLLIDNVDPGDQQDDTTSKKEQLSLQPESELQQKKNDDMSPSKTVSMENQCLSLWTHIAHRSANRAAKIMQQFRSTKLSNLSKVAQMCAKEGKRIRQPQAKMSAKLKKIAREVILFWKRNEKEVRELKRIAERDALEQKRREQESVEAQRQARKLDFLITQSELYSHFIAKKLGTLSDDPEYAASSARYNLDNESDVDQNDPANGDAPPEDVGEIDFGPEGDDRLYKRAKYVARQALLRCNAATQEFDKETKNRRDTPSNEHRRNKNLSVDPNAVDKVDFMNPSSLKTDSHIEVPKMLTASLKAYQVKGFNWLANLYEQGINGILADEMGLGKTVQSIALLAHLAEKYDIWGPFLVVTPSSTLHNWQQEVDRFVPRLKAVPYWGDQKDRSVLRKYWMSNKLYTKDIPFNIVVTSYQIVVIDEQYFKRIKWQYMILDEAQAIKSSDSNRWKTLLGVDCRNRLLLTGTPIQNSMQELWALLHFIMPTLFDSHGEFSSWFSRDIESHAENRGSLDSHQLRKLHMILKPFMLRRVKKDVENELSEKIEIEVRCQLSVKQRRLYQLLKERLTSSDILEKMSSITDKQLTETSFGDNIMNMVMQFRKVCNHPGLFEKAHVMSPFLFAPVDRCLTAPGRNPSYQSIPYANRSGLRYNLPKLIFESGFIEKVGQDNHWGSFMSFVKNRMANLLSSAYIYNPIIEGDIDSSLHSFAPFIGLSAGDIGNIARAESPFENILFWILKGNGDGCIEDYYRRNGLEQPTSRLLRIVNTRMRLPMIGSISASFSSRGDNGLPPHISLGNVFVTQYFHSMLRRLPPAYIPGAYAPALDIASPSGNFSRWLESNFTFPVIDRACLTGAVSSRVPATRHGDLFMEWIRKQRSVWFTDTGEPIKASYNPSVFGYDKVSGLLGDSDKNQGHYKFLIPSISRLISDSGKMCVLDKILSELKNDGHRVLIFFQMTKMIDIMEEYLALRQHSYIRLDGTTTLSNRRDIVMNWQSRPDLFIFLLSTRAGGVGINLTAADTVIFYDSDWNPTVDQQAMDRCHRLGQKKQVTIYRLITADTIEERILTRAKQKDKIQRVVISDSEFKQQAEFKRKEMYNLLLEEGGHQDGYTSEYNSSHQGAGISSDNTNGASAPAHAGIGCTSSI